MIINEEVYVVKSNRLITSYCKFTITEYRIMNYVFSKINTYDKKRTSRFTIKIPELIEAYGLQGLKTTLYETVKNSIENDLFNRTIKYWCDKENSYVKIHWLKKIVWNKDANATSIDIELNDDILDDLYELNKIEGGFTKIQFEKLAELNSYYNLKLLELLESKKAQTKKNVIKIQTDELSEIMKLPDSYSRYCNLNSRILIPAAKKFQKSKKIDFTFKAEKVGHGKESFIRFYINKKPTNKKPESKIKESRSNVETVMPKNHLIKKRTQEELDIASKGIKMAMKEMVKAAS